MSLNLDDELMPDESPFSFQGHYKNLVTYFSTDNYLDENENRFKYKKLVADINRIRLSPEIRSRGNFMLHCDIDNEIIAANYVKNKIFDLYWIPSDYNDLFDPSIDEKFSGDYYYRLKLHRLYAKFVTGNLTITLGRQQIRFGSGRLWNPLDILNPVAPTFVEGAEDQKGTDALRLEYYPGESTEIAFVYAPKRVDDTLDASIFANKNTNAVARVKTTVKDADLAVLGGRVAQRNMGGIDIAAIAWDGMLRGSLLYSSPDEGESFILGSAGYEYNFSNGIYCLAEYFYNKNALNRNSELSSAYFKTLANGINEELYAMTANQFITFNRHYFGLALGYDITPLLRGELFTIVDAEGRGVFVSPSLKYNILQNLDISITGMLGHVSDQEEKPSDFKEFEEHPMVSGSLKWYF
ncbi:MAG: hypothetical protein GY795_20780 [Desulfobacterales bacterium]|nr:hypothetical protein [Desulfobacterales bacterium]